MRQADTLVVPKLDRLARSVPDARAIADRLRERDVKLALGRALYDPGDPMGKLFFNILATFAEFEADLIRMHTREGMAIARGQLRGKQPKLSDRQQRELCRIHATGEYSISDLAEPAPSQDQPSIAHSTDPIPLSVRSCPLPESTRTCSRVLEVDHVIPPARLRAGNIENLQLLCAHCNRVKGDRPQEYLVARLRDLGIAAWTDILAYLEVKIEPLIRPFVL